MRLATLFSGIGAPEQGAKRVYGDDLEMVFACEWDKFARQSFEANYDIAAEHFHKDVNDLDGKEYRGKVDVLVGGSPCQAFSIAGLRNGTDDERGQLIYQYIRVVDEVRAPVIVYENVKGMMSIDGGQTIREFVQALRDIGYHCHYEVVNTKDYGVPQNRERIFLVGFLDHEHYHRFEMAAKVPLVKRLKDVLEDDVDEKFYVKAEVAATFEHKKSDNVIGELMHYNNETMRRIYDTEGVCTSIRTMQGGNLEPKIFENQLNASYKSQANTIHNIEKLSPTLCAFTHGYAGGYINTGRFRKLTPRECLRLQDFPDTFKQVCSDSQQYKQAGNSMSVNVLEMIFKQIEKAKSVEPTGTLMDFYCV